MKWSQLSGNQWPRTLAGARYALEKSFPIQSIEHVDAHSVECGEKRFEMSMYAQGRGLGCNLVKHRFPILEDHVYQALRNWNGAFWEVPSLR